MVNHKRLFLAVAYSVGLSFYYRFSVQVLVMLDFPLYFFEEGRMNYSVSSSSFIHLSEGVDLCDLFIVFLQDLLYFIFFL